MELTAAALNGHVRTVELLIEAGAQVDIPNKVKCTSSIIGCNLRKDIPFGKKVEIYIYLYTDRAEKCLHNAMLSLHIPHFYYKVMKLVAMKLHS